MPGSEPRVGSDVAGDEGMYRGVCGNRYRAASGDPVSKSPSPLLRPMANGIPIVVFREVADEVRAPPGIAVALSSPMCLFLFYINVAK